MSSRGEIAMVGAGFGFLTGNDGGRYFFHRTALEDGVPFESLYIGQVVEFTATEGTGRGARAEHVRLLGN